MRHLGDDVLCPPRFPHALDVSPAAPPRWYGAAARDPLSTFPSCARSTFTRFRWARGWPLTTSALARILSLPPLKPPPLLFAGNAEKGGGRLVRRRLPAVAEGPGPFRGPPREIDRIGLGKRKRLAFSVTLFFFFFLSRLSPIRGHPAFLLFSSTAIIPSATCGSAPRTAGTPF